MNARKLRSGLSVLEFIGCLMALVGGLWLGAIYLGIDVQHLAYVALSESKLMNHVPDEWRPVNPQAVEGPSQSELAASVRDELAALRQDIASLRGSQSTPPSVETLDEPGQASASPAAEAQSNAQQASLDYWQRLSEIVRSQHALELDAESAATEGNAAKVATLKARICRLSATGIEALPTKKVDLLLVDYGRELADWFDASADVYDQAVQVWGTPSGQAGNPQLAKQWQQSYAQLQNEGQVLRARATTIRDAMAQQFGVDFPPIAGL